MISDISIIVAAHKEYVFPEDEGYMPLHVGRSIANKTLPFSGDDSGDSISYLNRFFCELTGMYWMWKNQKAAIYGLVHYRRYFKPLYHDVMVGTTAVAASTDLAALLKEYDIILSTPRNYWVETVRKHYENAHYASDLTLAETVISELYPQFLESFQSVMNRRTASLYNMFVMRSAEFHAYCEWLFSILFELQNRIPYQTYGPYQGRVFGFLAERLLNVWVDQSFSPHRVKYLPAVNLEGENRFSKAIGLLERKFKGIKQV